MSTGGEPALRLSGVSKSWRTGRGRLDVLRGVDLTLCAGEVTALRGRSGSGKSTLLAVAGLLAAPDSGQVLVRGLDAAGLDEDAAADVRAREVGMVFQAYNLVVHLSALDNVALAVPPGTSTRSARQSARVRLAEVGLDDRADHLPGQLSGGEQQRVAVARALVNGPAVLLADEPTGNLDADSELEVLAALRGAADGGCAVLVVTHDREVAEWADVRRLLGPSGGLLAPEAAA